MVCNWIVHWKTGKGGTCYFGVPGDVPFSRVYFLPQISRAGY